MGALALASSLLLLLLAAPAEAQEGSPACPCLHPWAHLAGAAADNWAVHQSQNTSYPEMYGAGGCSSYDAASGPCATGATQSAAARPTWCDAMWCYVNASTCERPNAPTAMSWQDPARNTAMRGLAFSYETCGNVNDYSANRHYDALRGKTLRVSFPADSSSGYTIKTTADGKKDGSVVEFMNEIADEVGFILEPHEVSHASRSKFSSSFTACVHEVAINETDLCIGNFWVTTERLLLAQFTGALYNDEFQLLVPAVEEADKWKEQTWKSWEWDVVTERMGVPALPFTSECWTWIFATLFYMCTVLHIVEDTSYKAPEQIMSMYSTSEEEHDAGFFETQDESSAERIGRMIKAERHKHSQVVRFLSKTVTGIVSSFYAGLIGLAGGTPRHEGVSLPARVVLVGFVIFSVVILASYTASSAASLIYMVSTTRFCLRKQHRT